MRLIEIKLQQIQNKFPSFFPFLVAIINITLSLISLLLNVGLVAYDFCAYLISSIVPREQFSSETIEHVVITGASAGIGKEIAKAYAKPGVRLTLISRSSDKLKQLSTELLALGSTVDFHSVDVTDSKQLEKILVEVDEFCPIDLVIVNAGVNATTLSDKNIPHVPTDFIKYMKPILQTNYTGAIFSFEPLLKRFMKRRSGQIGVVCSLAGIIGAPIWPSYCSSKFAIYEFCRLLRPTLAKHNVKINLICPGFVNTAMTSPVTESVEMISSQQAASWIKDSLANNAAITSFPFSESIPTHITSHLPEKIISYLALNSKMAPFLELREV